VDRDLERYLADKGWRWREVEGGRQIRLEEDCPFCGKPQHLMFSAATTKWDCKRCGESGNLLTMKRKLGDLTLEPKSAADIFYRGMRDSTPQLPGERPPAGIDLKFHRRLVDGSVPEVLEYVMARGFTEETIRRFKLGVAGKGSRLLLSIPHYYRGELVCMKFRSVPPDEKQFTRWKDCPSVLFNGDCLRNLKDKPPRERVVYVCEGETDAMALSQLGYKYVVGSTTGAGKVEWPAHWLMPMEPATSIHLVYDSDGAGEDGALKAATALGRFRCKRVTPPLHDCAKMVEAGYGKEQFDEAVDAATAYDDSVVRPTAAYADELRAKLDNKRPRGRATGWVTLDVILGGIRDGELTVITGDTGSGKSTLGTALARNQALQDAAVLIAPFEQPCHEILGKLVSMEAEHSIYDMGKLELEEHIGRTLTRAVYFLDRRGPTPFGQIKDAIYLAVHRYGVRFVLLDHLHFFLDCKSDDERGVIDQVVRALKVIAEDLGIHIALVVHPAKLGRDHKGNTRKVVLDDLKGSSEIKKTADLGIRVWRERKDDTGSSSDNVEMTVLKCRSPAGGEGSAWFYFDPNGERYLEGAPPPTKRRRKKKQEGDGESDGDQWGMWSDPH
jgi:twinkle protein